MKLRRILCLLLAGLLMITMVQIPMDVSAAHENVYVNTGNYHADIIGVARTQVGYRETMENKTKYGAWYGMNYQPWCAMFVTWCARQAQIPKSVVANSAVADPGYSYFNVDYKDGKEYIPTPGDIFFTKSFSHTGLVFHVEGEYFYSLEGNTNSDGSDNGHSVMCLKHKREDYYFGVYEDSGVVAPEVPNVSTAQKVYSSGQTIRVQWEPVAGAVSYSAVVYKNGEICANGSVGNETYFDFKHAQSGEYLVSVAAHYADGTAGYAQHTFDVAYAPSLYVQYNVNGGTISPQPQYVVVGGEGVDFRSSASTGAYRYDVIPIGTLLTASKLDTTGYYTWAKVEYAGRTGWCIVSDGYCQRVGYTQSENGDIIQYPHEGRAVTTWGAGSEEQNALLDPQTAGLWRENHAFVGWSKAADGSDTIFRQDQTDISADQIDPNFAYADSFVQMYAIWRKIVGEITIEKLPDKTEYFPDDTLDLTGLQLRVKYVDGTEEVVDSGFRYSGFDSEMTGTKTVTVHYYDATTTFEVNVNARLQYEIQDGVAVITHYEQGSGVVIVPAKVEGVTVTAIASGAFADCSQITGLILPSSITQIGEGAFSGCSSLSVVNFNGSQAQWDEINIGADNEMLTNATLNCGYVVLGDYNGDMQVNNDDVIYLLWHTLYPKQFPVATTADLNADGLVNNADVIRLLWHTLYPDNFPLLAALSNVEDEEPVEEPAEEPVEEPAEEPAEEPVEEPAEEPAEEPVEEPAEEPVEEPAEEPVEEPAEKPKENSVENPTEEFTEESTEESTEIPAEELPQES